MGRQIGVGTFKTVKEGTYQGKPVAVQVLRNPKAAGAVALLNDEASMTALVRALL